MIFWTPEREKRLAGLADGTRSASQIAAVIGCSRNAVIGKIERGKGRFGRLAAVSTARRIQRQEQVSRRASPRPTRPKPPAAAPAASRARRQAGAAMPPAAPAPLPKTRAPISPPMPFLEAVTRGRCLYFACDPFAPDGPDMPVCGGERSQKPDSRYCPLHEVQQAERSVA